MLGLLIKRIAPVGMARAVAGHGAERALRTGHYAIAAGRAMSQARAGRVRFMGRKSPVRMPLKRRMTGDGSTGAADMASRISAVGLAAATVLLPAASALAQSPAEFYKGKTVELQIGYSVGGGYDTYARLIARHIGRHIPGNPTVIPKNMEGAGGMRLANWLYGAAPKDGTVFGAVARATAFEPLLGNKAAQYDGTKFTWIGSANDEVSVCVTWHTSGVATLEDARRKEVVVGANGVGDDTYQFPALLNNLFGSKFKMVTGYPGGTEINLAMERGEVFGRCGFPWSTINATYPHWLAEKKINLLMQFSLAKHADLPDVPLVTELARTDVERAIVRLIFGRQVLGRPYTAPPGVPKDRADALRKAFTDTMADKEFLAEVEKAKFEITAVAGDKIESLVTDIYKTTPPAVAEKAAAMMK